MIINATYDDFAKLLLNAGTNPNLAESASGMGSLSSAMDMHRLHRSAGVTGRGGASQATLVTAMISSAATREHLFTFEEYVRIAEHSPTRLEFWDGVILDMAGGTPRHSAICSNVVRILGGQLRGRPCRTYDANLKVRSAVVSRATFADAAVVCGPLQRDPADRTGQTVLNPSVLIEVHSPSSEADDCGPKLDCYKTIASVKAVVLVSQDERRITVHEHQPDGRWPERVHVDGVVELNAIGCTLPVNEVYEDLPE